MTVLLVLLNDPIFWFYLGLLGGLVAGILEVMRK
jgi:hypothetical protein